MDEPYEIVNIEVGILKTMPVRSVKMSRERFIRLVDNVIDSGHYSRSVRDKLMPVAQTMPRFPLGTWIDTDRGCGCVVGEYLVATSEIDRIALVQEMTGALMTTVEDMLRNNPDREELIDFGGNIDWKIIEEIYENGLVCNETKVGLYDGDDVAVFVDSVEIVD